MLARYSALRLADAGSGRKQGQRKLVFINLQKRLLSSVEAFHRTLQLHARAVAERDSQADAKLTPPPASREDLAQAQQAQKSQEAQDAQEEADAEFDAGLDESTLESEDDALIEAESARMPTPSEEAGRLLQEMTDLARSSRGQADAKVRAFLAWMRENMLDASGGWTDRRVIVFTEYADTKRYLLDQLRRGLSHGGDDFDAPDETEGRILQLHGGMGEEAREEVQAAFNTPPAEHPARILIATDAAREGLNLQAHCADLFHFDIPWNPSRMEQRNGRIDRRLQQSPEVRCHYFVYPQRAEDRVLDTLVHKTEVIRQELGSLSAVVLERMGKALDPGIEGERTLQGLEEAAAPGQEREIVTAELETSRAQTRILQEIEQASASYTASAKRLNFREEDLRHTIDVGLQMLGYEPLQPVDSSAARAAGRLRAP